MLLSHLCSFKINWISWMSIGLVVKELGITTLMEFTFLRIAKTLIKFTFIDKENTTFPISNRLNMDNVTKNMDVSPPSGNESDDDKSDVSSIASPEAKRLKDAI